MRTLPAVISITFALLSCRSVDLTSVPREKRTLYAHNFTNTAFQPDVNVELTEVLRSEISRRGNFIIVSDKKDAAILVYGDVGLYRKESRMYDNFRNPVRHELMVGCTIKVRPNPANPGAFTGETLPIEVSSSVEFSDREGYVEQEEAARRRLLRILASRIAAAIEEELANRLLPK